LLYRLARWARTRSSVHQPEDLKRTTDAKNYRAWRKSELEQQLRSNFNVGLLANRNVLDFGCGTGELSALLANLGPAGVTGVDTSPERIAQAQDGASNSEQSITNACAPRFLCNEQHDVIPLSDDSVDLICCFDVVEHIPDMATIARQWRRVLRPGGRVWIWWSPWRGPFGHHVESLIPIPWVHLLASDRTLFKTCAAIYDDSDYVPRKWDCDANTGAKKPNPWRATRSFHPFLNRLTRRQFERIVTTAGLRVARRRIRGFGGSALSRSTRVLLPLPLVGDCFVSYYIYELAGTE
jgi:SAM-dependent methyltransferase